MNDSQSADRAPGAYFVAGTDTGVGKTFVTVELIKALKRSGRNCLGLKPVAAGCQLEEIDGERRWVNDDALLLRNESNVAVPYDVTNPIALPIATSPHIAAKHNREEISFERLTSTFHQARAHPADIVLVEGAGGWRCPLSEDRALSDFAVALQLPVILVVGIRLGCLNHAVLTAEAIQRDGLTLTGWIANELDTEMFAAEENIQYLQANIDAPCIGHLPYRHADSGEHQLPEFDISKLL